MPAAFKTALGSGLSTSSSTTVTITTTAAIAIGDLVVVRAAADSTGTTTPTISSVADGGNTYTILRQAHSGGASLAGLTSVIAVTKATVARPSSSTITVTFSAACVHKATYAESFTGVESTVRSTAVGTVATGTTSSAASAGASGTVNAGDLVLGFIANETRGTITGDSDTTNGSWSTQVVARSATSGTDAACISVAGQYKITTASGAQTYNVTAVTTDWAIHCAVLQATPDPTLTQAAYQFFDETGTESGATALAAQNTAVTGDLVNGDGYGLVRVLVQSTTAVAVPATDDFTLQWERNASGSWTNVGTGAVVGYNAPSLTEGQATTNRLTGGTGTFTAGKVSEDGVADDVGWSGNNFTELVYSVRLVSSQFSPSDTLRFRVVRNGSTFGITYSATPTVNIIKTPPEEGTAAVTHTWVTAAVGATPAAPGSTVTLGNVVINPTNSKTINKPTGLADGDHLVAWYWRDNTGTDVLANIGIPGFTDVIEYAAFFEQAYGLYIKRVPTASSEPSTYTMTYPDADLGSGRLMMAVLKTADPTTPINVSGQDRTSSVGSDPLIMPAVDPTVTGGLGLIFAGGYAFSLNAWTVGSGWSVEQENTGASVSLMVATADAALPDTPTSTVAVTPSDSSAKAAGVIVVFAPVPAPTGTVALDDFNRVHASSWGANWTTSTFGIGTNSVDGTQGTTNTRHMNWVTPAETNDQYTEVVFVTTPSQEAMVGFICGGVDPGSGYELYAFGNSGGYIFLQRNGVEIRTTNSGFPAGTSPTIRLEKVGAVVKVLVNGAELWSYTDGTPLTGKRFGVGNNNDGGPAVFNNFKGGDIGGAAPPTPKTGTAAVTYTSSVTAAVGKRTPKALTTVTWASTLTAAGVAPVAGVNSGSAAVTWAASMVIPPAKYLNAPTGYASMPDPGTLAETGVTFVYRIRGPQILTNADMNFAGQGAASPNYSWGLLRRGGTSGATYQTWSTAGTSWSVNLGGTITPSGIDRIYPETYAHSVRRNAGSAEWNTFRSLDGGHTWAVCGTGLTGDPGGPPLDGTQPVLVGRGRGGAWDDRVYWVECWQGFVASGDPRTGTMLWRFDANDHVSGTTWTDARGHVWTLTLAGAIQGPDAGLTTVRGKRTPKAQATVDHVWTATAVGQAPIVVGAPDAPTLVRPADAFGYNGVVSLTWTAPTGTITDYVVQVSSDNGSTWITHVEGTSSTPSANLTGLTFNTRYLFRVAAVGSGGQGAWAVSEWGCTPVVAAAPQTTPTGTTQSSAEWGLARIDKRTIGAQNFRRAWTGAGVRIYHVDSGIHATHNEFDVGRTGATVGAFTPAGLGGNALAGGPGHGTQTASKAVGATLGVAPGADLWVLQAWPEDSWSGTRTDEALQWIIDNHPRGTPAVVTSSTTFNESENHSRPSQINPLVARIVDELGLLYVQCTGNTFSEPIDPLAARTGVIHVGSTQSNDAVSSFNIFDPRVDIFAPGGAVLAANIGSDTDTTLQDGTSYGTPMVAGVVATWLQANPTLTPVQLQDLLFASSTKGAITGNLSGQPNRLLYTLANIPVPVSTTLLKGVGAVTDANTPADLDLLNVSWWYDWASYSTPNVHPATPGEQYVPMMWGDWINDVRWGVGALGGNPASSIGSSDILLGFNEPDVADQANMTVARALALWPQLEATGARLGSPAVGSGGISWLQSFMSGNGGPDPRVDFVCVHWYPEYDSGYPNIGNYLDYVHSLFPAHPIWLTEVGSLGSSVAANNALMPTVMAACATRPWIERVAWFVLREGTSGWAGTGLITTGGALNAAGTTYSTYPPGTLPPELSNGSAAVTWVSTLLATGKRTPKATSAVTWTDTLTAVGKSVPKATTAPTWASAVLAAGKRVARAVTTTTWVDTLTSVGKRSPKAVTTTAHTWVTAAAGVAPIVGVKQGNATVAWSSTVTAVGKRTPKATSAVTYASTVLAAGKRVARATTAVLWDTVTAAVGKRAPKATTAVTYTESVTTAVGKRSPRATTATTHTWATLANGFAPTVGAKQGFAAVAYSSTVTAVGKRTPKGGNATVYSFTVAAAGKKIQKGTAAVTWAESVTTAVGKRVPKANVVVPWTETLIAVGKRAPKGSTSTTYAWATLANGVSPILGLNQGFATITYTSVIAAVGKRTPKSSATVAHTWPVTVAGKKIQKGVATTTHLWVPTAAGKKFPTSLVVVTYDISLGAVGKRFPKARADVTYREIVLASGISGVAGLFDGLWNGDELVAMQYGDKAVIAWLLVPA